MFDEVFWGFLAWPWSALIWDGGKDYYLSLPSKAISSLAGHFFSSLLWSCYRWREGFQGRWVCYLFATTILFITYCYWLSMYQVIRSIVNFWGWALPQHLHPLLLPRIYTFTFPLYLCLVSWRGRPNFLYLLFIGPHIGKSCISSKTIFDLFLLLFLPLQSLERAIRTVDRSVGSWRGQFWLSFC